MKLQQLRYLCGVVQEDFNMSRAAETLGTSQPAISKQLRLLERELQVDLLLRRGNRILGLTVPGEAIIESARRTLWETENLRRITSEFTKENTGRLVIATTHTYARYVLGPMIKAFMQERPHVQLVLRQGTPSMVAEWVVTGEADLGISGRSNEMQDQLTFLPCTELKRSLYVPEGHPLLRQRTLTHARIAKYPLIMLDADTEGGRTVRRSFEKARCKLNIVLSVLDADVAKTYVEMGLGVAVLLSVAYDGERDGALRIADASRLFEPTVPQIVLHQGRYLTSSIYDFIQRMESQWSRPAIENALLTSGRRALRLKPASVRPIDANS